jgi:hypothetical protein
MTPESPTRYLNHLPLWRLLVMLDDAERCDGPDSATSRMLARIIRKRLAQARGNVKNKRITAELQDGGGS